MTEYDFNIQRDQYDDANREKRCQDCKHCGWDPDGNYCASEASLKESGGFGRSLHVARSSEGPCYPEGRLFEAQGK